MRAMWIILRVIVTIAALLVLLHSIPNPPVGMTLPAVSPVSSTVDAGVP